MIPPRTGTASNTPTNSPPLIEEGGGGEGEEEEEGMRDCFTYDQFLELFFLFDNTSPGDRCPHGEKDIVQVFPPIQSPYTFSISDVKSISNSNSISYL